MLSESTEWPRVRRACIAVPIQSRRLTWWDSAVSWLLTNLPFCCEEFSSTIGPASDELNSATASSALSLWITLGEFWVESSRRLYSSEASPRDFWGVAPVPEKACVCHTETIRQLNWKLIDDELQSVNIANNSNQLLNFLMSQIVSTHCTVSVVTVSTIEYNLHILWWDKLEE